MNPDSRSSERSSRSRVGIVWNHDSTLGECSFRFEQYVAGLEALGCEAIVVCSESSARGLDVPITTVPHAKELDDPAFWRSLELDIVLAVTWHRMSAMLRAVRASGAFTVSIADTDGEVSFGEHPAAMWRRLAAYAKGPRDLLRCARYFLRQWSLSKTGRSAEDAEYLASTEASDSIILGNSRARDRFERFLQRRNSGASGDRLRVVPFTVAPAFFRTSLNGERRDRVVAIGRWSDPQKHAPLLASALTRYLETHEGAEAHLVGAPEPVLTSWASSRPDVRHHGLLAPEPLAKLLASSRSLLFASRWEGSPHSGFEALAMGLTLVGTPMPCIQDWCGREGFGTMARRRSSRALAEALAKERGLWQTGQRDPEAIGTIWRERLDPARVCSEMLPIRPWQKSSRAPSSPFSPAQR